MRQFAWLAVGVLAMVGTLAVAEEQTWDEFRAAYLAKRQRPQPAAKPAELTARTYSVADLVAVSETDKPRFDVLMNYLRGATGPKSWEREGTAIREYGQTLSLVIRQTPDVHEIIAEKLGRLRRDESVQQVMAQFVVITGPHGEIAALAERFPGEFGEHEKSELLKALVESKSKSLQIVTRPQVRTLNRMTMNLVLPEASEDGPKRLATNLATHYTLSDDRRSIRVKISTAHGDGSSVGIADVQLVTLHDGRTAAVYFEAERILRSLPPADDAQELLVLVTPRIVREKEEEGHVLMVTPPGGISDEEEELLGIPTDAAPVQIGTVTPRVIVQEEEEELLEIPVEPKKIRRTKRYLEGLQSFEQSPEK